MLLAMSRHEGLLSPWTDPDAGSSKYGLDTEPQPTVEAEVEERPATDVKTQSSTQADKAKRAQSCDSCRRRKIKCIQLAADEGSTDGTRQCRACHSLGTKCTYIYIPKRPGPQTSRTGNSKHARQEEKKAPSTSSTSNTEDLNRSILESLDVWPTSPSSFPHYTPGSPEDYSDLNPLHTTDPSSFAASFDSFPSTSFAQPSPSPFQAAGAALQYHPTSHPRSLQDIAPRHILLDVILVYFNYLYPLLPIVHRPTYERDLAARLDEFHSDFLAFTLSLAAVTLVDAPQAALPISGNQRRELHRKCHQASRSMQQKTYESAGLVSVATLYLDYLYLAGTNRRTTANAVLAEAVSLAYSIGLHVGNPDGKSSEASSSPGNVIEREMRRRIFYMLYSSDKTVALLQSRPMMLRDDSSSGVPLPLSVDDDMLFPERANVGHASTIPSALDGFVATIKLSQLLSEILETRRGTERCPPTHAKENQEHRAYINVMLKRVKATVDALPKVYKSANLPQSSPFSGGMDDFGAGSSMTSTGLILAIRANIAITWTVIRFALAEYQDLLTIPPTRSTLASALQSSPPPPLPSLPLKSTLASPSAGSTAAANTPSSSSSFSRDSNEYDLAVAELSETLQSIPLEYLLMNGHRFHSKLLYITSSMFQRCPPGTTSYTHLARLIDLLTQVTLVRNEEEAAEAAATAAAVATSSSSTHSMHPQHLLQQNQQQQQQQQQHHHHPDWTTPTRTNTNNSSMTPIL